jgi:D-alanyl-lipoteichoic acid acyltransferase DltB (MBOAT superfamily)
VLFPTVTFTVFFLVVWPLVWAAARHPRGRMLVLVAAGAVFYGWWDERFLALLGATVLVNHLAARVIQHARSTAGRRAALWLGVAAHLGVLGWYKYYGFFASSLTSAFADLGIKVHPPLVQVALPLGLSFFTFQAVSHLVEVHRGIVPAATLLQTAAWLSFFPTIVSGPIVRPSELVPQLTVPGDHRAVDSDAAFWLIIRGLAKKVVIASYLASTIADPVFASPQRHGALVVLIGIYAFAIQLYCDFSGYSDIAIGCALLLGFRIPQNFNDPYRARSVTEFWERWHITLSRWLRDFVFMPLARRSRRTTAAVCRNLVIVMVLAGLWHGAGTTFLAFGLVHGIALAVERAARERRRHLGRPAPARTGLRALGHQVLTFHVVCLGWVFFRAESMAGAGQVLGRLASGAGSLTPLTPLVGVAIAAVLAAQHLPPAVAAAGRRAIPRLGGIGQVVALAIALVVIDVLGPAGIPPFLYFRF